MTRGKLIVVSVAVLVAAIATASAPRLHGHVSSAIASPPAPPELPRGGTTIFPDFRVVAYDGAPQAKALGILGIGKPARAGKSLLKRIKPYARPARPVLPAFELIAAIALDSPGKDGKYRSRQKPAVIRRYLAAARKIKAELILDIQPGRANFLTEVKALSPYLSETDVSVALDPEWRMHGTQAPGQVIGHVSAAEINRVSAYLAGFVRRDGLPDKLLVIHQFTSHEIHQQQKLKARTGIETVLNADGVGSPDQKRHLDRRPAPPASGPFFRGFKVFRVEDTKLMKPKEILRLKPSPVDFVAYE